MTTQEIGIREIPFGRPWIDDDDRAAVMEVLKGPILTHGPRCKQFESDFATFLGSGHAVSTSSCMTSLSLAASDLGLGPGQEVIVPAMTHVATVHAVALTGATPIFVDCDPSTGNINIAELAASITPRSRAIFVVHFAGIPINMDALMSAAGELPVVEDCAIAIGSRWRDRHVGLFGHAGCFSFYPVKHITTGEGGMFVSADADVAARVARFRAFSVDRDHGDRAVPGLYDVSALGTNGRMSELQAALGCTQVRKLPVILERRAANFKALSERLIAAGVRILDCDDPQATCSHYCVVARLPKAVQSRRNDLALSLKARGIGTSTYYPHPVPRLRAYQGRAGFDPSRFPGAVAIADHTIALPVGPHLSTDDMHLIADAFLSEIERHHE